MLPSTPSPYSQSASCGCEAGKTLGSSARRISSSIRLVSQIHHLEKTTADTLAARDQFWNLAKSPITGFSHYFHTLRSGLKLHYIANKHPRQQSGNLVIFLHGFPDSCMMWRHLLQEPAIPTQEATLVCVDLPGYGGSDSLDIYDTQVLEALAEFVVAMRDTYLIPEGTGLASANAYIVGHDWGCVLAMRLAAEAPSLADRFILTNGPHVRLTLG